MREATLQINDIVRDLGAPSDTAHVGNELIREYFELPTNASAARILLDSWQAGVIYERLSDHSGRFWKKTQYSYWEPFDDILLEAQELLSSKVLAYFDGIKAEGQKQDYERASMALRKARTRDFLESALVFLGEAVLVPDVSAKWNRVPECLPVKNGIIAFSGNEPVLRDAEADEYFRDPLDVDGNLILVSGEPTAFRRLLADIFPDSETRQTALETLSLAMPNKGHRVFALWNGSGANGKSLLAELMSLILGNRAGSISGAALTRGNDGARRFAAAQLDGKTFAFAEEVQQALDVSECKRLSGASAITVERKGADSYTIPATWILVVLSNSLPAFSPATDAAFLTRLIVLPFKVNFYKDEESKQRFLRLGTPPELLRPAGDKSEILAEIEAERAAILRLLIDTWMEVRKRNGAPLQSKESLAAYERYRQDNDKIESFFLAYFERKDGAEVSYETVLDKWREFFGEKGMPSTRMIMKQIRERLPWITSTRRNSVQYLVNITLATSSTDSTQNSNFKLTMENHQISNVKVENDVFSTESTNLELPEINDADLKTASNVLSKLVQVLIEAKDSSLKEGDSVKVPIESWRTACAAQGLSPDAIAAAEAYMQGLGLSDGKYLRPKISR